MLSRASEARFIRAVRLERTIDNSSSSSVRSLVMSKDASIDPVLSNSFIVLRRSPGESKPREYLQLLLIIPSFSRVSSFMSFS